MEAKDENIETVLSEPSVRISPEQFEDTKRENSERCCHQLASSTFSAGAGLIKIAMAWVLYRLLLLLCFLADIPKYYD